MLEVPGSNPILVCFFFDYIIEDKVFEKILSSNATVLMVYVYSVYYTAGRIAENLAVRIDTAYFNSGKLAKQSACIIHSIRLNSISRSAYIGVTAGRYADVGMR